MRSFYDLMGVDPKQFDPQERFVTSWLLPPSIVAGVRLVFALFGWTNIIGSFVWYGNHNPEVNKDSLAYFTNLTWWGITLYMTVASVHTLVYATTGRYWLQNWPRPLQLLHSFFYTTIVVLPPLVTLVFWIVLYSGTWFTTTFDAFSNVSRHGLNSLAALVEIIIPATNPPPFLHIPFLWLLVLLYLCLAYIVHAADGLYTYDFINPSHGSGRVAAYSFGIAAAILVIFLLVWGGIWIRRKFTGVGKKARRDANQQTVGPTYSDIEMSAK